MSQASNREIRKIRRLQNFYNAIPNLVWSALSLVPITVFCYQSMSPKWFWIFLGLSFLPLFFPNILLDKLQIGRSTKIYKKLGVHFINRIAQNGEFVNRLIRKRFPDHKVVSFDKKSSNRLVAQTYVFEKFHLMLFIFFTLAAIYAFAHHFSGWAWLFILTNILYNVYPNLLQQYIRVKLRIYNRISARKSA